MDHLPNSNQPNPTRLEKFDPTHLDPPKHRVELGSTFSTRGLTQPNSTKLWPKVQKPKKWLDPTTNALGQARIKEYFTRSFFPVRPVVWSGQLLTWPNSSLHRVNIVDSLLFFGSRCRKKITQTSVMPSMRSNTVFLFLKWHFYHKTY